MKKLYLLHTAILLSLQFIAILLSPIFVTGQSVTSFTLVDTKSKKDIGTLKNGDTLILSSLPSLNLNVRANTKPDSVGSVLFSYDTISRFNVENVAPYALAGDNFGAFNPWTPDLGVHTIIATPYSDTNATGTKGKSLKINFKVVNDSSELSANAVVSGELKKWHRVTITFDGPSVAETTVPNPFLDYRLDVTFTHSSGKSYKVPGYFAADGNAAETGAISGKKWRVHFSPDMTGVWTYSASFRKGRDLAVSDDANAGIAVLPIDGATDTFSVKASDKTGRDLRAKGRLEYVGAAYLQFAESKEFFRKAGSDAPENFLAYQDFDNTPDSGGRRKTWAPHIQDWNTGDPTWKNGKGKGIIGAVNYLSGQGMDAFSFLTMNINGDDKNVYPYISPSELTRIDVSKMDQWEIVMEHAQKMGMYLHFKMQETENNNLLDGGDLGIQRKLYCRELIARFSHHLALNWNEGEENTQTDKERKDMARYLHDHDPYKHNIVVHTKPGEQEMIYRPLLGKASDLTGASIQTLPSNVYKETRKWVEASADSAKKWIVANDEQNPADIGVAADSEYTGKRGGAADNSDLIRQTVLWGNLMAGGAGVEYYFGYNTGETDLSCQDFRSRAKSWRYANYALDFFRTYLPSVETRPLDNASKGWSLGKDSQVYVIYLRTGGTSDIDLPFGTYSVKWYNPRTGGALQNGSVKQLKQGTASIGYPPSDSSSDWAVLIQRVKASNNPPTVSLTVPSNNATFTAPANITLKADASDTDGSITRVEFYIDAKKVGDDNASPYNYSWSKVSPGSYSITAKAFDDAGDSTISSAVNVIVNKGPQSTDSIVFAVNAGGNDFTSSNGITYLADTNFIGGKTYRTTSAISNTSDEILYQTERFGNFSYAIPATNGRYEITFKFAEIYETSAGKRIFDVLAEDSAIISNLDIYAQAGENKALDIVKTITVSDNMLNIQFRSDSNFAKISALQVKSLNGSADTSNLVERGITVKALQEEDISVYPNPTTGFVTLTQKQPEGTVVKIFNDNGVSIYENSYVRKSELINLSKFRPGIYFIQVVARGKKITRKVILMKQ